MFVFSPAGRSPLLGGRSLTDPARRWRCDRNGLRTDRPGGLTPPLVLAVIVLASTSCAISRSTTSLPPMPDGARLAEEVRLSTDEETVTGKITGLTGDTVVFIPAPYWRVESRAIHLEEITAIQVENPGYSGQAFVWGFAAGFVAVGLSAGSSAEYNEDYSAATSSAVLAGLATGLLGSIIAGGSRTTTYEVGRMSVEQRRELMRRLMTHESAAQPRGNAWAEAGRPR